MAEITEGELKEWDGTPEDVTRFVNKLIIAYREKCVEVKRLKRVFHGIGRAMSAYVDIYEKEEPSDE